MLFTIDDLINEKVLNADYEPDKNMIDILYLKDENCILTFEYKDKTYQTDAIWYCGEEFGDNDNELIDCGEVEAQEVSLQVVLNYLPVKWKEDWHVDIRNNKLRLTIEGHTHYEAESAKEMLKLFVPNIHPDILLIAAELGRKEKFLCFYKEQK